MNDIYVHINRLKKLEKGFILDGVPLSKLANDEVGRTNPTLNLGIPQYMSTNDPHCQLDCTCGSSLANDSMMGSVNDKFLSSSAAKVYIENRKNVGAGDNMFIIGYISSYILPIVCCFPTYACHQHMQLDLN